MTLTIMTMTIYIMTNDLRGRKCKGVPDPWGEKEARQSGDEVVDQEDDDSGDDDDDDNNDGDDDIYILMHVCLSVCHEKSSLPPYSLL